MNDSSLAPQLHLSDAFSGPRGRFQLWVRRSGVLVPELCMDEPNLIVTLSKTAHARLLGGDVVNRSITQIGFGTSGTAPAIGNTSLTGAFLKDVDTVSYPTADSVKFDFSLGAGENNGMAIMEVGLFTEGSVLYARRVRSTPLNKDSEISFAGAWTITF